MNMFFFKKETQKGNTIFAAILIVAVLLLVATSVGELAYKEHVFSSYSLQSQKAFYAADTGIECALFLDFANGVLNPPSPPPTGSFLLSPGDDAISGMVAAKISAINASSCSNLVLVVDGTNSVANATVATTTFYLKYHNSVTTEPCTKVEVGKRTTGFSTLVLSTGYDSSVKGAGANCNAVSGQDRRVQRTLTVHY